MGVTRFCHLSERYPDFANFLTGGGAPSFRQILIMNKIKITQIRVVIKTIMWGTQILSILRGAN